MLTDDILENVLYRNTELRIGIFGTRGTHLFSRSIIKVIGGKHSHVGIIIYYKTKTGEEDGFYYEALVGKGFVGPKPITDLYAWGAESPDRVLDIYELNEDGLTRVQAHYILGRITAYSETVTYGELQLLAYFFFVKHISRIRKSSNRVVCSEIVGRCLIPRFNIAEEMGLGNDELSPKDIIDYCDQLVRMNMAEHTYSKGE